MAILPYRTGNNSLPTVISGEYMSVVDTCGVLGWFNPRDPNEDIYGCYGFVNDTLYLGDVHHAEIIAGLIQGDHDVQYNWESLMNAKQVWGWYKIEDMSEDESPNYIGDIGFSSDDAKQTYGLKAKLLAAFREAYPGVSKFVLQKNIGSYGTGGTSQKFYGDRARSQYLDEPTLKSQQNNITSSFQKTADWVLSWVYDAVDKNIYTGANHIDIIPEIPEGWEKAGKGHIICGWYNKDWDDDVYPSIATDTVDQDLAKHNSPIADEAQKAAMKYWHDNNLAEEYNYKECPECGDQIGEEDEHQHYCDDCCDWYYSCDHWANKRHNSDYCDECGEHVDDIDEHNDEEHANLDGLDGIYWSAPGANKLHISDGVAEWTDPYGQKAQGPTNPSTIRWDIERGLLKKIGSWQEIIEPAIIGCVDLHDDRVFAKLSRDYISLMQKFAQGGNNWLDSDDLLGDYQKGNNIYQGLDSPQINNGSTDDFLAGGYARQDEEAPTEEPTEEMPQLGESKDHMDQPNQPDDPRMLEIYRNKDSQEFRWSYDGTQLHMWRVFNRNTFGPSHYDMFGFHGYDTHSQGRVYVSPDGKVGMLYWQITHPECERVLNEWCMKTFNKLPDYVYRAYGPYLGYPVGRHDFPLVEVSQLPLSQRERWWDIPGGSPGMKVKDYPAPKQKNKWDVNPLQTSLQDATKSVNDLNKSLPKSKRRKRKRNQKYRNRSFRGR